MEERLANFLKDVLDDGVSKEFGPACETEAENRGFVERVSRPEGFVFHVTEAGLEFIAFVDSNSHDLGEEC